MIFVLPLAFLVVGLGLGGGLLYASQRMRTRVECIQNARPCKAGSPVAGLVKMHGTVQAVNPGELLVSPIEQRPCVYYKLVIEQFRTSSSTAKTSVGRAPGSGSWEPIVEDVQAVPMVIADETGDVAIDPKEAQLDFKAKSKESNLFTSMPKELEESLRERYKIVTKTFFIPKQMRYTEVVIAQDAEVFVVGDCEMKDGKATLTRKDHPLLLTFRKEQEVVRNSKITATICTVAAVVVSCIFLAIAALLFTAVSGKPAAANQNAVKNSGKANPAGPHKNAPKRR
jgi:hypothetical protein